MESPLNRGASDTRPKSSARRIAITSAPWHWVGLIGLVGLFLATPLLIPIEIPTPLVDEPIFAKSAFHYARTGEIAISGLSAPNAVFDTVWGGTFVRLFDESYWSLRFSSLTLVALSAPFMYLLCRSLGAASGVSLLATATYLFGPLVFSLSNTFMTDSHAMALLVIAMALTARSLSRDPGAFASWWWVQPSFPWLSCPAHSRSCL